jgi:peptidoglycan-N-acetylglucosamine deacetylase
MRRSIVLLTSLALAVAAHSQQLAITFDDLPAHGPLPAGDTRLQIAQSILGTIQREKLPPIYGFINAGQLTNDPSSASVLKAWTDAGQPLGNHTYEHVDLNEITIA